VENARTWLVCFWQRRWLQVEFQEQASERRVCGLLSAELRHPGAQTGRPGIRRHADERAPHARGVRAKPRTRTCSGRCAAAAETSGSSRASSTACTRSHG